MGAKPVELANQTGAERAGFHGARLQERGMGRNRVLPLVWPLGQKAPGLGVD